MLRFELADVKDAEMISELIRKSFKKQAEILGIKKEGYPNYVAFETAEGVRCRMTYGDTIIIAYLKDEPVGTVSFHIDLEQVQKGYIKRLAVLPEFRGNKYGQFLMIDAETRLKKQEVTLIELNIAVQFESLQKFYEGLGYIPGERRSFSTLPFEVLFMEKKLGNVRNFGNKTNAM